MENFWTIFVILLVITVPIVVIYQRAIGKAHKQLLDSLPDFTPTYYHKAIASNNAIAMDVERKKIAVIEIARGRATQYTEDDIISVDVIKNDASILKTNRGSQLGGAVVGAALLGPIGLLLGGLSGSKREVSKVYNLSLRITTKSLDSPLHDFSFFKSAPPGVDAATLEYVAKDLDIWHARLRAFIS